MSYSGALASGACPFLTTEQPREGRQIHKCRPTGRKAFEPRAQAERPAAALQKRTHGCKARARPTAERRRRYVPTESRGASCGVAFEPPCRDRRQGQGKLAEMAAGQGNLSCPALGSAPSLHGSMETVQLCGAVTHPPGAPSGTTAPIHRAERNPGMSPAGSTPAARTGSPPGVQTKAPADECAPNGGTRRLRRGAPCPAMRAFRRPAPRSRTEQTRCPHRPRAVDGIDCSNAEDPKAGMPWPSSPMPQRRVSSEAFR